MLGLKIGLTILLFLFYIIMMAIMIIFERDKPRNIIIWSIVFLLTSVIGYIIYIVLRNVFYKKKASLVRKEREDEIYLNLVSQQLYSDLTFENSELYEFNKLAYNAKHTTNNSYKIFNNYDSFKENLITEIKNAKNHIFIELTKIGKFDIKVFSDLLIERALEGIEIKFLYDKPMSKKVLKSMKSNGIKVYKFSKYNTIGKVYANKRNVIVIDNKYAFIGNLDLKKKQIINNKISSLYLKLSGDIIQEIDLNVYKDIVFASGKFIPYSAPAKVNSNQQCNMQFVTNEISSDIELLIIKAICMAKDSIQLQLESFVPTESIISLLRFAINSNIDVRLMVPLKTNFKSKYYASRAYAKQLATYGANVYLYDGYIDFNSIVIDNTFVLYGSFILDREHLNTALQNVLVIENSAVVNSFNKIFDDGVDNSYRISNAKNMLLSEKFFKNFV